MYSYLIIGFKHRAAYFMLTIQNIRHRKKTIQTSKLFRHRKKTAVLSSYTGWTWHPIFSEIVDRENSFSRKGSKD